MINFMLDNLRRKTGQRIHMILHLRIRPGNPDRFVSLCFPDTRKGEAPFLRIIFTGLAQYYGIQHGDNDWTVADRNDPFSLGKGKP